jgi:hypothetical protein
MQKKDTDCVEGRLSRSEPIIMRLNPVLVTPRWASQTSADQVTFLGIATPCYCC